MVRKLLLPAVILCAASAAFGATEVVFHDIAWPRHNAHTGHLESILHAEKAMPKPDEQYFCIRPRLSTYKLVEEDGRRQVRRNLFLRAEEGLYNWGAEESQAQLTGNVEALVYYEEPIAIRTPSATLQMTREEVSGADGKSVLRDHIIQSPDHVEARSRTRTLTGREMLLHEQVREDLLPGGRVREEITTSMMTIRQNPRMTLREEGGMVALPAMPGMSGAAPDGADAVVVIETDGPLVVDRLANVARFRARAPDERVVITRGTGEAATTLASRVLTIEFEDTGTDTDDAVAIKRLVAEQLVRYTGRDEDGRLQQFAGERFEWDPTKSMGTLSGSPATMDTADLSARAPLIEFNQEENTIRCSQGAQLTIELRSQ